MWRLKVVINVENTVIGRLAQKHKVTLQMYPLIANTNADCLVNFSGVVCGLKGNSLAFLKELGELQQIKQLKTHGTYFVCQYQDKAGYEKFYNKDVFYIEPWTIDGITGLHHLHLGAWEKEHLSELYTLLRSSHKGNMLKITEDKSLNLFLFSIFPQLTQKQREAMELAIQHGYYDYPRKVEIKELARIAGCSFSTFHAHLRKAERKVIPAMTKSILTDTYR
jgi:predicted DNA binding protein